MTGIFIPAAAGFVLCALVVLALAIFIAWCLATDRIGRTINDARARNRQHLTKWDRLSDRETARAIGIGGAADLIHMEEQ